MSLKFRSLVACLLMLLLPLQGMASAAGLRVMSDCPMRMTMAAEAAEHGDHATLTDQHATHGDHHSKGGLSCDMGMTCPALGALAMVSASTPLPAVAANGVVQATVEPLYISHVPEGLQRPPQYPA
jgi:hypothetical protein